MDFIRKYNQFYKSAGFNKLLNNKEVIFPKMQTHPLFSIANMQNPSPSFMTKRHNHENKLIPENYSNIFRRGDHMNVRSDFFLPNFKSNGITDYFQKKRESGKKVIALFAIGGGNDTFSAIHVGKYLKEALNFEVIFFGVLGFTPYHSNKEVSNSNNIEEEKVITPTRNLKRYLMTKCIKEINNNEKELPEILKSVELGNSSYYLYSPKYDPCELAKDIKIKIDDELKNLGMSSKDLIILASDYGGDVLGYDLSTYSPDLDSLSVRMIEALDYDYEVQKLALILWPGVDGELSKSALLSRFQELADFILAESKVNDKSPYFQTLMDIYNKIEKSRPGNTIPNAINILSREGKGVLTKSLSSRKGYTVEEKWDLDISEDLVRTAILLPLVAIMSINPFTKVGNHQDLLELFIKIMNVYDKIKQELASNTIPATQSYKEQERTDFHMQYLRLDNDGLWTSKNPNGKLTMQILVSPTSYTKEENFRLLEGGVENLKDESTDIALAPFLQFKDYEEKHCDTKEHVNSIGINNYMLLWKKPNNNAEITKEVDHLKERIAELTKTRPKL